MGLLLRRDVAYGYRSTLIAMASVAGVIILLSLLTMLGAGTSGNNFHLSFFGALLFVGGFIYTSLVFRELHNGAAATLFLTLPSSTLEKFASKALVTSVGYAVGVVAFSTVTAALSEGLNWLIFRTHHELFNPADLRVLRMLAFYLVTQSVFLLGSVYYRKLAFVKTAGVVSLISIVVAILAVLLAGVVFRDHLIPMPPGAHANIQFFSFELDPAVGRVINGLADGSIPVPIALRVFVRAMEVLFWAALAPACWVIGWLKVREKEV